MLKSLMNRFATPFITGLFLSSLISGVLLFFGIRGAGINGSHEWLSMVLIIPFVLHVAKNWKPLIGYFRNGWLLGPLAASLVATLAFYVPGQLAPTGGSAPRGNPVVALAGAFANGTITEIAPLLKKSPQQMTEILTGAGYNPVPGKSLNEIATAAGKSGRDAVFLLISSK